jgi:hypothetical protein
VVSKRLTSRRDALLPTQPGGPNSWTSGEAPIASGKIAVKDRKRQRAKYSVLGTKNRLPSNRQRMLFTVAWRSLYQVVK